MRCKPPQPFTDLRDYRRRPQFQNHWIAAVSGLKFFRETSFALSLQLLFDRGWQNKICYPAIGSALGLFKR